jgi:hypothetical protein
MTDVKSSNTTVRNTQIVVADLQAFIDAAFNHQQHL